MKIATRKIKCPKCEKTVSTREQVVEGNTNIYCLNCKELVWSWDKVKWSPVKKDQP